MDYAKYKRLEFRRKFFRILGAEIDITDPESDQAGALVGFIEMKAWKLREDVRIYSDKSKSVELFNIHARTILDFGVTYDVSDSQSGEKIFTMRRKGLRSAFLRDQWEIGTPDDKPLAVLQETSSSLALLRRYTDLIPLVGWVIDLAMSFFPIQYTLRDAAGETAAEITHRRNPIIDKFGLDRSNAAAKLDPRVAVVATAMLSVVDSSKN